jgi:hypothetical protein
MPAALVVLDEVWAAVQSYRGNEPSVAPPARGD